MPEIESFKPSYAPSKTEKAEQYDRWRGTAASRGYDRHWTKARDAYLSGHPLCERCSTPENPVLAELVHHKVPVEVAPSRLLDPTNFEALCKRCHQLEHHDLRGEREPVATPAEKPARTRKKAKATPEASPKKRAPRAVSTGLKDAFCKAGYRYAEDVVAGKIPACKFVRQACQRSLDDYRRQDTAAFRYRFDSEKAGRACQFISRLPHVKGPKARETMRLEPWQSWVLTQLFGWLRVDTGKRRYLRSYLEVPKGNGKTFFAAGVGLYMLLADGEFGAEVYSAATSQDQARICWAAAAQMVRMLPDLRSWSGVEAHAHHISVQKTNSIFRSLSSDADNIEGVSVHCAVIDELHAHRNSNVFDNLITAAQKRDQSLIFVITTAGVNLGGVCYMQHEYMRHILDGTVADEQQFGCIWTIDDGDDWREESSLRKANPNWGVSVMAESTMGLIAKAVALPIQQPSVRTKHLCEWLASDSSWMEMAAWFRCGDRNLREEDFSGQDCWLGLDLAATTDMAAKVKLFTRWEDGRKHYYCFSRAYLPESKISTNTSYQGWEVEGRLISTPGSATDFDRIKDDVIEDCATYKIRKIGVDRYQSVHLMQGIAKSGFPTDRLAQIPTTVPIFSPPMKTISALVAEGRLHHDGDPLLAWAISNVVCHTDHKDNIFPNKAPPEEKNKIDPVIALIIALALEMDDQESGEIYADGREIFVIPF